MYNSCNQHTPKTKGSIRWRPPLHSLQSDCPQDHLNLHIQSYTPIISLLLLPSIALLLHPIPCVLDFPVSWVTLSPSHSILMSSTVGCSIHLSPDYSIMISYLRSTTCYYSIMYLCVFPPQSCLLLVFPNFFFSSSCVLILLYYILPVTKHSYVVSPCY